MIHILLLILKIIGIVLLAVLGLLLVILLAVLFIPVRYKAEGSYRGCPRLSARVSWLFRFIVFRASYSGDVLVCSFRILGIRLWHNKDKDAAQDLKDGLETILGDEEQTLYEELQQDEANFRRSQESGQNAGQAAGQESGKPSSQAAGQDSGNHAGQGSGNQAGHTSHKDGDSDAGGRQNDVTGENARESGQDSRSMPGGIAFRITSRLKRLLEKLKFSFRRICDKLKGIREFAGEKKAWLEDDENQASLRLLYRQTKRLAAHMWPCKGKGSVTFGFDDPYTTGQALQAASLIYPFYHRQLSLYPVFDEKILEAEGHFKGRIRLAVVLWLALRIFFDRHTRRMLRGFLK